MPNKSGRRGLPKTVLNERKVEELITIELAHLRVTRDDPEYLQFITVSGKGLFSCGNCEKTWSSYRSFVKVDLVDLCLSPTENRQGCKKCKFNVPIECWPTPCFKESFFNKVLQEVLNKYKKRKETNGQRSSRGSDTGSNDHSRRPHDSKLCERCIKKKPCCN